MLLKMIVGLALTGLSATLLPRAPVPAAQDDAAEASGRYTVDPVHSTLLFRVQHLGAAFFWGRFNEVHGTILVDHESPEDSYVRIRVPVNRIDTNGEGRDEHLRGPDFFDARQFPDISFESTKVVKNKPGVFTVTGDLELHGVTREITFNAVHSGHGKVSERFGYRTGYEAEFTIRRQDFGISYMSDALGNEVRIIVSLECRQG